MRILLITLIAFILTAKNSDAEGLPTNNFDGFLKPGDLKIKLMFRLHEQEDGELVTKMYIPTQEGFGEKSTKTLIDGDTLRLYYDHLQMHYYAYIDRENKSLTGTYYQGRNVFDMNLNFISDDDAITFERPQQPVEPFPYIKEEVTVRNERDNVNISGTLFLPDTVNKHNLVIFSTGGGAPLRNQRFGGHHTFFVIADLLVRNNIAVFIYDERGVGKSTGRFRDNTTRTFMIDAYNSLRHLKNHKNINPEKIGFLGHSEGALVAFKVASTYPNDVGFIVSMSGPGVPIIDLMKQQVRDMYRFSDHDEETIEMLIDYRSQKFDLAVKYQRSATIRDSIVAFMEEFAESLEEKGMEPDRYGINLPGAHQFISQVISNWLKYFLRLNPSDYIERTKCPVLIINGDLDMQINAELNVAAIEEALKKGGNNKFESHIFEGLNHIYQPAVKGTSDEYMLINETISEDVLQLILSYIQKQFDNE